MTKITFVQGTVISQATLRDSDLLRAFSDALAAVDGKNWLVKEARKILHQFGDFGYSSQIYTRQVRQGKSRKQARDISEQIDNLLWEHLFVALDAFSPEGCYFGAHPGDGSLFGYWKREEVNEE